MSIREEILLEEVSRWPDARRQAFEAMLRNGTSATMAHMLASRQAPGVATDDTFLHQDYSLKHRVKNPLQRQNILKKARAAGLRVTEQSRYEPGLGKGPQDPRAWFTHGTGRGELQRRLDDSGKGVATVLPLGIRQPAIKETPPAPRAGLAPDLVEEIRQRKLRENPALAMKDQREVRADIIEKHGSKVKG